MLNNTNLSRIRLCLLATTGLSVLSSAVFAQTAPQGSLALEEITVTARKREEVITQIPLSITTFSANDISERGLGNLRDISAVAPGLTFSMVRGNAGGGRTDGNIYFRGMPSSSVGPRAQTGSLFLDGIYVLGAVASIDTNDVERIEVIKGPQSAYFGRNTFGGAVNFITKVPGNDYAGVVIGSGSTRGSYGLYGAYEGPIVQDKVAARLSVNINKKGGEYTATDGGTLGEETTKSVSGTVVINPSDSFTIRLRGHYQHNEDGAPTLAMVIGNSLCPGQSFNGQTAAGAPTTYTFKTPYFCGAVPSMGQLGVQTVSQSTSLKPGLLATLGIPNKILDILALQVPEINNNRIFNSKLAHNVPSIDHFGLVQNQLRLSSHMEKSFANGMSANLNVAYNTTKQNALVDVDHSDFSNNYTLTPSIYRDASVEARIASDQSGKFRWLVGGNYIQSDYITQQFGYKNKSFDFSAPLTTGYVTDATGEHASVASAFGSIEWNFWNEFTATVEGRYQVDKSLVRPTGATSPQLTYKTFLPRYILKYAFNPDSQVYISYSKGVLPGQANPLYITATPYQQDQMRAQFPGIVPVLPSSYLSNYEAGVKQRLWGGRVEYAVSGYYMKWSNILSTGFITTPTSATNATPIVFTGINIPADANLWGVEFETHARITSKLTASLTAAWQSSEYTNSVASAVTAITGGIFRFKGNKIDLVPDITANLGLRYEDALTAEWDWFAGSDLKYVGKAFADATNTAYLSPYYRLNLRAGVSKGPLRIEGYVTNALDDKNWDNGFRSTSIANPNSYFGPNSAILPVGALVQAPDRREFGLKITQKF